MAKSSSKSASRARQRLVSEPFIAPQVWTNVAFGLTLALAIARAMMNEVVRDAFPPVPTHNPAPHGVGPAVTLTLNAICFLPAFLVLLRRLIDNQYRLRFSVSHLCFALLAIWATISVAWSTDKFTAVVYASTTLAAASLIWSTMQLVRSWLRLRLVAGVCVGLLMFYSATGLEYRFAEVPQTIKYWNEHKSQELRDRGWTANSFEAKQFEKKLTSGEMIGFNTSPNSFAAVLVMLIVISAGAAIQRRALGDPWGWTIILALILAPALLVLYYTGARTAGITLILAALCLTALASSRLRNWLAAHARAAYFVGLALFLLAVGALIGHGIAHGSLPQDSLNFRWRYWVAATRLFKLHPLLGVGWGNFGEHYLSVRLPIAAEEVRDPHNFIVRAFSELGFIGGILALAWIARSAWELTRATHPANDNSVGQKLAVFTTIAALILGVAMNYIAAIDFSQGSDYLVLEFFQRILALGTLFLGLILVAGRPHQSDPLDSRPAPWLLRALVIAIGLFFLHNLMEFVFAEPGPMIVFAMLLGAGLGARFVTPRTARAPIPFIASVSAASVVAWVIGVVLIVLPIVDAEQRATQAADDIRANQPASAAALYHSAFQEIPYNSDYAFEWARALMFSQAPAQEVRAAFDFAQSADPTDAEYFLTRAGFELRSPNPDVATVRRNYDRALTIDPQNVLARLDYADALVRFGDVSAAIAQYRAALKTNSQYYQDPSDHSRDEPKRLPAERVRQIESTIATLSSQAATHPASSYPARHP